MICSVPFVVSKAAQDYFYTFVIRLMVLMMKMFQWRHTNHHNRRYFILIADAQKLKYSQVCGAALTVECWLLVCGGRVNDELCQGLWN